MTTDTAPALMGDCMNCAQVYRPRLSERLARFLGYKYELGEDPEGHEQLSAGWARTTTRLKFTWLGRLRLLFSGRLKIELTHYANLPIDRMSSRVDLRMYAPWERGHD
jgi:hypothetical protein